MHPFQNGSNPNVTNSHLLLAYVADLELEVDRLRKQHCFLQHEARETLKRIQLLCVEASHTENAKDSLAGIDHSARQLAGVLRDMHELPGYHPAHDQVIAIAVRPLIEQVFRWQQRLTGIHKSHSVSSWQVSTWSGFLPGSATSWTISSPTH